MLKNSRPAVLAFVYALLASVLVISLVLAIYIGAVDIDAPLVFKIIMNKISGTDIFENVWTSAQESIVWNLRLPKVMVAGLAGAGLALSGMMMQALTKNPLAEPYILGISSGASTGAVVSIMMGSLPFLGSVSLRGGAFLGAMLSSVFVFAVAGNGRGNQTTRLVLTGMGVSYLFSSATNLIIFLTPESKKVNSALFWMTGSFGGIVWGDVLPAAVAVGIGLICAMVMVQSMDALLLGEAGARTRGVDTAKIKVVLILASTLMTAVIVSMSGIIGFVGLVIPHIGRSLVGASHRRLIPVSVFLGAIFMIWCDVIARVCVAPEELPVGVITAIVGAPVFLIMLKRSRYAFGK